MRPATPSHEAESRGPSGPERLPPLCGDFNMRIDRNGTWYYQGSPIGRVALVKLFATVLRRDDDGVYWLTTPVENGRIEVEDVPFIAVELTRHGQGHAQALGLRTNLDDTVEIGPEHPLVMRPTPGRGDAAPYVRVRANLEARLARAVYYQLVDLAEPDPANPKVLGVWSNRAFYPIGTADLPPDA
ncbi:MAG: DUF1285 domain-containing protein [Rhodospirillaceae bacterium]|nr:DUF1285 domain-containing protein [Rhodospirillaceae bacterium]